MDVLVSSYKNFWKYAIAPQGRTSRGGYWYPVLVNMIIYLILFSIYHPLGLIFSIAVLVPGFCASVRRLHDVGKSAWYLLLELIPIVGSIVLLVFTLLNSKGANKYGTGPIY